MSDESLRAAAEGALVLVTCGGHQSMGSLVRCEECTSRNNAQVALRDAASPDVVLDLLDRLGRAEGAVARCAALADGAEGFDLGDVLPERIVFADDLRAALELGEVAK